jgi:hypothetical protein
MIRLSDKLEAAMKAGTQGDIVLFLDFDGVISTPRAKHATGEWADPMTVTRFVLMAEGETKKRYQLVSHPTNERTTRG